jgi:hypothetical protein
MNPQYFMDTASFEEIEDFLMGASERYRMDWERTRLLSFVVSKIGGSEADDVKEFMPFEWDDENNNDAGSDIDEEKIKELRELAKKIKI